MPVLDRDPSHYEYVRAGTLNLSRHGFLMMGGGESLSFQDRGERGLGAVIEKRADELHACIGDLLKTFVAAAREHDGLADPERAAALRLPR